MIKTMDRLAMYHQIMPVDDDKLKRFIEAHTYDLIEADEEVKDLLFDEISLTLFDDMTKEDLIESFALVAAQNIQNDPIFDRIAMRFKLTTMLDSAVSEYDGEDLDHAYRESFVEYIKWGVKEGLLDPDMVAKYNLYELALYLKPSRDDDFTYIGLTTAYNRYTIKNRGSKITRETPQFMWMRVAMGMALMEEEPAKVAKLFYDHLSTKKYTVGGSTMIAAGTPEPSLANCFLLDTEDDMEHIFENIANVAHISKATGGIGIAMTKLRAEGSPIRSNNTFSSGPIPFINIIDATIAAVSRAGKKKGATAIYMENWHYNFREFLDLRQNAGDDYRRVRTANTAVYISDEFMKRAKDGGDWYMFDPLETPELTELYGKEFSEKYKEYEEKAKAGELNMFRVEPAREQYKKILTQLQSTSHPWLVWKDTINLRALNDNTGTIHCSNLCTEVCLPQDRDNIAVCNLAYVNLPRHIERGAVNYGGSLQANMNKAINWDELEQSVRVGMRHLDNLIDVGHTPLEESRNADEKNRAVGLGIMGFSEALEFLGYAYDSEEAYTFIDQVIEFISYVTIDESCNLAEERGAYENFNGSEWSKGLVPYDTIERLEEDRGLTIEMNRDITLDWDKLRSRVRHGVRNATTMMIAPNGNSSLTAGTSPGIDPRFALIFSRTTLSGKFLDININLANELKSLGIWDEVKERLLENQGDISMIDEIPDEIKRVYKTSFQIDPKAYVEVASRAQKWIDQAMSRNMYLQSRDIDEMMDVYSTAWERGLKTTYYLHMKPRHTAEQSTVKVNKAKDIGKSGFGVKAQPSQDQAKITVESPGFGTKSEETERATTSNSKSIEVKSAGFGQTKTVAANTDSEDAKAQKGMSNKGFGKLKKQGIGETVRTEGVSQSNAEPSKVGFGKRAASVSVEIEFADSSVKPVDSVDSIDREGQGGASEKVKKSRFKKVSQKDLGACPVDPRARALCDGCE